MTTELTQPSSAVQALSAGQTLRNARELQNLTTAQVAQQLNLSKSLIDDLERDQVDAKLSSTFVRGYLRSYAKLLKLPVQQVLDAYSSNSKGLHQVPSLTRSFSKRTAKEATENRFMWVTYFVIAVFVVLLVLGFWQSRYGTSASGTALPMAQTDETMLASAEAEPADVLVYGQASQQQASIPVTQIDDVPAVTASNQGTEQLSVDVPVVLPAGAPNAAQNTTDVTATPQPNQSVTDTVPAAQKVLSTEPTVASPGPQSTAAEDESVTTAPIDQAVVSQGAQVNSSEAVTQDATTPGNESQGAADSSEANATISLSLNAECWVDVVDATGKRLVFGSRQAGEQLNLRGVAPVKVLLGNAAAASLSFNGEAIDLSGYPTGRVARLTLGQN